MTKEELSRLSKATDQSQMRSPGPSFLQPQTLPESDVDWVIQAEETNKTCPQSGILESGFH